MLVIDGFSLFGINIKFYGLIIALGMVLAIFVVCKICKYRNLKTDDIIIVALYILPLSIIGARLYYVLFSEHSYTFWEIFKIWEGGMAIYGGVIGGTLGVVLYCLIHKKNFFLVGDVAVIGLILGQAIGRIGCYFSSCCYGIEVTNPGLMWFPLSTQIDNVWHLSTFFYESICDFIIFAVLLYLITKKVKTKGVISSLYLICYGTVRCIIETFRGDSLYLWGIKVSQLLSGILVLVGIILLIVIYTNKNKKGKVSEINNISKNT